MSSELEWSDWLDFNAESISKIPELPGVFMMHTAMKILYIGGSANVKKSIMELQTKECTCDARRFKYSKTENYESIKNALLKEYQEKHSGSMPKCM
jgi:predicted GIY-YIG superfamily endonuclease